ncbi:MAG: glucosylceramidase [Spirochaetales bacterium]|nr:glucosylceramidase [Spirochaetales bacterium]
MFLSKTIQSSLATGDRLTEVEFSSPLGHPILNATVDAQNRLQTWEGFGAALTESSALMLQKLTSTDRSELLQDLFRNDHHGYTLCRLPLGSSDFSEEPWSTVNSPEAALRGEIDMSRFDALTLPILKEIQEISSNKLRILVSPWSPPPFMKTNNSRLNGGKLLPEWRKPWAMQFALFLTELVKRGFSPWAVTVQNEPEAVQKWDSCIWTATEEAEFAVQFLRPALDEHKHSHVKILLWDHNRDRLWDRAQESMLVPGAAGLDGFAFHWYGGDHFENVSRVAEKWSDKLLVFSEGCIEGGPRPNAWFTGERYAHNIIGDMNHGAHAWIDWNLALSLQGGPNHVANYCDAPILINDTMKSVSHNSSFWVIGHFSRFIHPGARRLPIAIKTGMVPASVDGLARDLLEGTAWINPDKTVAVILTNRTEAEAPWALNFKAHSNSLTGLLPPRSIQTLILTFSR